MIDFIKELSIKEILQYYAVICLALAPLNILLTFLLYKYTNLIERFDMFLDRHLAKDGGKEKKKSVPEEKKQQTDKVPADAPKDSPELAGISCFNLPVGQIYYCRQSSQGRGGSFYDMRWFVSNEFLGKIDEDGLFTALKAGRIDIFCARRNDDFDTGALAYSVKILPRRPKWTVQRTIDLIAERAKKEKVLETFIDTKIITDDQKKRILAYKQNGDFEKVILQLDGNLRAERAVYIIRPRKGEELKSAIKDILEQIDDRFEAVELEGEGINYWIHRLIDDEHDEVDMYAYLRKSNSAEASGAWILAIGQTWREYGEIEEFLLNIKMAEKMFADCLSGEDYIPVKAKIPASKSISEKEIKVEEANPEKDNANDSSNKDENTIEEKPIEELKNDDAASGEPEAQPEEENPSTGEEMAGNEETEAIEEMIASAEEVNEQTEVDFTSEENPPIDSFDNVDE